VRIKKFFSVATLARSACVCRCSPTQKKEVAYNIKTLTEKRIGCVGDGGNDVAMIQEADVGFGIEGKEGMQASLAADFSIKEFSHLARLILWHGRLSYKRTAALSQFVIHRGMIISFL
jgi:phospholipid-translocating ATPase